MGDTRKPVCAPHLGWYLPTQHFGPGFQPREETQQHAKGQPGYQSAKERWMWLKARNSRPHYLAALPVTL
jgi:hypothetical protein